MRELNNLIQGEEVNYANASFAALGIGFEVFGGKIIEPIGSAVITSIRASKAGGSKLIAEAVEGTARQAAREGSDAATFIARLDEKYSGLIKLAEECGEKCVLDAERVAKEIVEQTGSIADEALGLIDNAVDDAKKAGVGAGYFLGAAETLIGAYSLVDIAVLFFGYDPSEVTSQSLSTLTVSTRTCSYRKFRGNISSTFPQRYTNKGIPKDEIQNLSPHHIVPLKDARRTRCFSEGLGTNVCNGARAILERVGIDLNSPYNGVLLPMPKKFNDTTLPKFRREYPNATLHGTNADGIQGIDNYTRVW